MKFGCFLVVLLLQLFSIIFKLSETTGICSGCIADGHVYCSTFNRCGWFPICFRWTNRVLNCPDVRGKIPDYDENFVRDKVLVTVAATFNTDPQKCYDNQLTTMKTVNVYRVDSSVFGNASISVAVLSIDHTEKAIVMSFRGTEGGLQLLEQVLQYATGTLPFFDIGKIYSYFQTTFLFLWNAGMGKDLAKLKQDYPDYELWSTGYSLGGALASVAASYVVKVNLFDPADIKLVTMGQPRTGDYKYATWHEKMFPYSFRIVNAKDPVPHIPPLHGPVELFHHRTEVWYETDMTYAPNVNKYKICTESDGDECSNSVFIYMPLDHLEYFDINIGDWGKQGCPKKK